MSLFSPAALFLLYGVHSSSFGVNIHPFSSELCTFSMTYTLLTSCQGFPSLPLISGGWKVSIYALLAGCSHVTKASRQNREVNLIVDQSMATSLSGAVLGPFCDAQHSRYHVLQYEHPANFDLPFLDYTFQTCW